jgi:hypothetical protein
MAMNVVTLDQVVDTAMRLPPEQRDMLLEILRGRHIEARRREIAQDAQESLAAFRAGKLKRQSAEAVIEELRQTLEGME